MATDIERLIFKVELDGSAYLQGTESLANSTKKLTESQEKANVKLNELSKTQAAYKKTLSDTNAILQANEKETLDLTKQLNALKDAQKGSSAEAIRLRTALRDTAVNTKELKQEAALLKNNITATTTALKIQTVELQKADKANNAFTSGLGKAYSGLSRIASFIPGLGIAGLVALIAGPVVDAFTEWFESINKANDALADMKINQQNINEITVEANKDAGKQISTLNLLYKAATDVNLSMEERLKAVNALQAQFPDYFKNIKDETILNGDAKAAYDALVLSIRATARAKAAAAKLDVLESEKLDLDAQRTKVLIATANELAVARKKGAQIGTGSAVVGGLGVTGGLGITAAETQEIIKNRRELALADIKDKADAKQREIDFIIDFAGLAKLAEVETKKVKEEKKKATEKEKAEIENQFLIEKAKLETRLAALNRKEADNESKIRIEYAARLAKEQLAIEKLVADRKIKGTVADITDPTSKSEAGQLGALAVKANEVELLQALDAQAKKVTAAHKRLNDELKALETKNAQDLINLMEVDFDRRAKLIEFNEKKEIEDARANSQKRLDNLELDRLLIGEKAYQEARANIISAGELAISIIEQEAANRRKDLAADTFQTLLESYDQAIFDTNLLSDEKQVKELQALKQRFLAQEITHKQFRAGIKKIKDAHDRETRESDLVTLKDRLAVLDVEITFTEDKTTKHYAKLLKLQKQFRKDIAAKESAVATDTDDPDKPKIDKVLAYVKASEALANSIIKFWQEANDAEARALDRSIALQEKRADAAQKIAERGNAQYLKAEEDRLRESNLNRENAARKQLGIDAALQASQILVGITGAIAKIATPGIGIAETIGAIAVIVGALATGYGLVKSLQGNQPSFFVGTKDTGRGGAKDSKGGFAATLHPNEAVIPAEKNKAYKPAVAAIYDGTIPAEHMNQFVKNYHQIKSVALPDYGRIKEAAELKINSDGRMTVLLSEQNTLLKENNALQIQILKKRGVHAKLNVDKNGVGMMVTEYIEQMEINKKI